MRESLPLYATGPRPDVAEGQGFIGAKFPISYSSASEGWLKKNVAEFAKWRSRVDKDVPLAADSWMSFEYAEAAALTASYADLGLWFVEELLALDDLSGMRRLRRSLSGRTLLASGEHAGGVAGFAALLSRGCLDIAQPGIGWCGGLTVAMKIAALAETQRVPVIVHGPGPYGFHFSFANSNSPFAEVLMPGVRGDETEFEKYYIPEWTSVNGSIGVPQAPGFGLTIDVSRLERPYSDGGVDRI